MVEFTTGNILGIIKRGWGYNMEAYCFKCRAKREISNPESVTLKNGRPATQGKCPVCGTNPTVTELIDYEQFCGVAPAPAATNTPPRAKRLAGLGNLA